jgi:uncharacterized membrane protein YheB (UPF0754 family)
MIITMAILSTIGALIGWVTNVLAIKLIFRPLKPVKVPVLNFEVQGLIPKRRHDIAKNIAITVEQELVSVDEMVEQMITNENKREILFTIKLKISKIIDQKIPSIVPSPIRKSIIGYIGDIINDEGDNFLNELTYNLTNKAKNSINIAQMVEDKINSLELEKLEEMILHIANRELKHIEILGAVLGFVIGLFQGLLLNVLNL